jgi:uncharacterized protein (DUF433 family)
MNLPPFLSREPYGDILLTGQRLPLLSLLRAFREGRSDEEILEEYDTLAPERLLQVRDFYRANGDECDRYFEETTREIERQAKDHQPSAALRRLRNHLGTTAPRSDT